MLTEDQESAAAQDAAEAKAQDLHDFLEANAPVVIDDDEKTLTDEEEEFVKVRSYHQAIHRAQIHIPSQSRRP